MQIAILGAGNVGRALASRAIGAGMTVRFGARAAGPALRVAGRSVPLHSLADAAAGADVVLLCVPAAAAPAALEAARAASGTVVVDCTNPVRWDAGPVWDGSAQGSVAAALAAAFPALRVVKAFNHFGAEIQADPRMAGGPADAWVAADDADARARIVDLATAWGFRGVDAGPLRNAALLERVAILWIHLASVGGQGRQFAFRADHRP